MYFLKGEPEITSVCEEFRHITEEPELYLTILTNGNKTCIICDSFWLQKPYNVAPAAPIKTEKVLYNLVCVKQAKIA